MRIVTLTTFTLALCIQLGRAEASWSSYIQTNRYDFIVADGTLAKTPVWKEASDSPPLAPRKALRLARARLGHLISDAKDWTLDSIRLEELRDGHWIYLVAFEAPLPFGPNGIRMLEGIPTIMTIPVMMDGVAIQPKISLWKR